MKAILEPIIAVGVIVGMVLGAMAYFATAEDLQFVQQRLDQKIVADQQFTVQQQIWNLEERNLKYGPECSKWPDERDRKQYKELKAQVEMLNEKQKKMMAK
jgi:hypothetical protein